jgi:hypothetical protein
MPRAPAPKAAAPAALLGAVRRASAGAWVLGAVLGGAGCNPTSTQVTRVVSADEAIRFANRVEATAFEREGVRVDLPRPGVIHASYPNLFLEIPKQGPVSFETTDRLEVRGEFQEGEVLPGGGKLVRKKPIFVVAAAGFAGLTGLVLATAAGTCQQNPEMPAGGGWSDRAKCVGAFVVSGGILFIGGITTLVVAGLSSELVAEGGPEDARRSKPGTKLAVVPIVAPQGGGVGLSLPLE